LRVGSLGSGGDLDIEVNGLDREIARTLRPHLGIGSSRPFPGGTRLAAVFIAELATCRGFAGAGQVSSWAG